MPAKVDADERRAVLVLAAAELIAEEGVAGLTNARVAERLSASTTIVTHYFRSKRELVLLTYQTMATRSRERVERAARDAADPLTAWARALLALDDENRVEWRVWLAFQGTAVGDPELLAAWADRQASAIARLAGLFEADLASRGPRRPAVARAAAERLFGVVQGVAFQAIVNPDYWTPRRLRGVVDDEIAQARAQHP